MKFDLAWVSRHLASSDSEDTRAEMHGKLHALMQAVETIIQSVREIATTLRPRVLDELGLSAAIDWQTRDFEKRTGIRCQCSLPTEPIPVGPDQATTLFRIFQEILTNVTRHAQATSVRVRLTISGDSILLEVCDNGRGITEQELSSGRHWG